MTKFYSLRFEAPVFTYIPPVTGWPSYSQALDSLFVASYDCQGYGGGILTRLQTGSYSVQKKKLNSVAFSPQANYTDRATAACRRS
jgi:hypothetical protein